MAGKSAVFSLRVVADAKQASGELSKFERSIQSIEGKVDKLTPAATAAGVAVVGFGTYAGKAAAEAEQNFGAVDTVFKNASDAVHNYASDAAQAVGLSASSYESLAASIGGSLSRAGYDSDELAEKTNGLISAGADLSSVFGGDAAGAAEAMGAALRGEFDSLEQYGVFMSAAAVDARMAAEGTDTLTGAAYDAARQQATVNEIMDQAGAYAGNFANEADTAAGAQQRATAEFQNAAASLGTMLLPVMTAAANKFAELARWVQENQGVVAALVITIGVFAAGVFAAKGAILAYQGATAAVKVATTVWTGAQWALNAALNANPIGLIVIAIAAMVAAFIWAYNNVEWFRDGVNAALEWIKNAWNAAGQWIGQVWNTAVEWVKNTWNAGVDWVVGKYNALVSGAQTAGQWVSDAFNNAVEWVKNTWNAGVDWVVSKISGIADGARDKAELVRNYFAMAVDFIKGKFDTFHEGVRIIFDKIGGWAQGVKEKVTSLFDGFKLPEMPGWAKNLLGGGNDAYGYALGSDGVYYAPARGVDLSAPFMLTAAENVLAPVSVPRGARETVTINHHFEINFKGLVTDKMAVANEIKDVIRYAETLAGA